LVEREPGLTSSERKVRRRDPLTAHRGADLAPERSDAVVVAAGNGTRNAAADKASLQAHLEQLGVGEADIVTQRSLARMIVSSTIPRAATGWLAGRPTMTSSGRRSRVFLAGDWVGPQGVLSDAALVSGPCRRTGSVEGSRHVARRDRMTSTRRVRGKSHPRKVSPGRSNPVRGIPASLGTLERRVHHATKRRRRTFGRRRSSVRGERTA
jgi:hypothetical protein